MASVVRPTSAVTASVDALASQLAQTSGCSCSDKASLERNRRFTAVTRSSLLGSIFKSTLGADMISRRFGSSSILLVVVPAQAAANQSRPNNSSSSRNHFARRLNSGVRPCHANPLFLIAPLSTAVSERCVASAAAPFDLHYSVIVDHWHDSPALLEYAPGE